MTARVLKLFFLLLVPVMAFAQDTAVVKHQAEIFAKATFTNDVNTIIEYTHPALIELSGGRQPLRTLINERVEALKKQGILSFDGSVGSPGEFNQAGKKLLCLLPEDIILRTSAGRYRSRSYLLGVSTDSGLQWTFLDVGNMPLTVLERLLPEYNGQPAIPSPVPPEFLAD